MLRISLSHNQGLNNVRNKICKRDKKLTKLSIYFSTKASDNDKTTRSSNTRKFPELLQESTVTRLVPKLKN